MSKAIAGQPPPQNVQLQQQYDTEATKIKMFVSAFLLASFSAVWIISSLSIHTFHDMNTNDIVAFSLLGSGSLISTYFLSKYINRFFRLSRTDYSKFNVVEEFDKCQDKEAFKAFYEKHGSFLTDFGMATTKLTELYTYRGNNWFEKQAETRRTLIALNQIEGH